MTHYIFFICLLLAGTAVTGNASDNPLVTFKPGRFGEFIVEDSGRVVLFPSSPCQPSYAFENGQWLELNNNQVSGTVCDAIRDDHGAWHVLEQNGRNAQIFRCSDRKITPETSFSGLLESPTLHKAADGALWVTSREGIAYTVRDGKVVSHAFGPAIDKSRGSYWYYPATLSLEIPGLGLWFWSHLEYDSFFGDMTKQGINGFDVYRDGQWSEVNLPGRKFGGVALTTKKEIICGVRAGQVTCLSASDSTAFSVPWKWPSDEHCIFLHRLSTGTYLAITAKPSVFMRPSPEKDGWTGTLLKIRDNSVEVLLDKVDLKRIYNDKGRPVAETPVGTFLAAGQSGLLFVPADMTCAQHVDWRFNVPVPNINRLRYADNRLYMLDRQRGFAIMDLAKLRQCIQEPVADSWEVQNVSGDAVLSTNGSIWYVTASLPGELKHRTGSRTDSFPMNDSLFSPASLWYLALDSRDRVWLLSNHETHRTALLENGKWRTFNLRETAYSTVAAEEKGNSDFRIGTPTQHFYPAFAGDGRVAYRNEWKNICFFDGSKWDYGCRGNKINGSNPDEPPFYSAGILTAKTGGTFYQFVGGNWVNINRDINSPYTAMLDGNLYDRKLPPGFPGDNNITVKVMDNIGTTWAGTPDRLFRGIGNIWVSFPTEGTPIMMADTISSIIVDGTGGIWFNLSGGSYLRLARHHPAGRSPMLKWTAAPDSISTTGQIQLNVQCSEGAAAVFSYRVDNGEWNYSSSSASQHVFKPAPFQNGTHVVDALVYDSLLRSSTVLSHKFSVARNYQVEIKQLITSLGSGSYAEREAASSGLVNIGTPAIETLMSALKAASSDQAWWLRAVIEEIERKPGSNRGSSFK